MRGALGDGWRGGPADGRRRGAEGGGGLAGGRSRCCRTSCCARCRPATQQPHRPWRGPAPWGALISTTPPSLEPGPQRGLPRMLAGTRGVRRGSGWGLGGAGASAASSPGAAKPAQRVDACPCGRPAGGTGRRPRFALLLERARVAVCVGGVPLGSPGPQLPGCDPHGSSPCCQHFGNKQLSASLKLVPVLRPRSRAVLPALFLQPLPHCLPAQPVRNRAAPG